MAEDDRSPLDFPRFPKIPGPSPRIVQLILVVALGALLLFSSVYTVDTEEVGIILRVGKYRGASFDVGPGLHFKLPLVDRVIKVPVERQLKEEFGFRTAEAAVRSTFTSVPDESLMVTGDKNAAVVEWVVQYRIVDAYRFVFKVRNVESTFRDMSEAVMRKIIGDRTVNEVVTVGRVEIENEVKQQLQKLCDQYDTGIRVDQVVLQTSAPPDPVKPSFNEVNQAEQDRDTLINQSQSEYNRVIPKAEGDARKAIEQAEGYALDRVNRSEGDAARFRAIYAEYRRAPEVTRKRLYLETMNRVLPQVGRKVILDDGVDGVMPLLNLDSGTLAPQAAAAARAGESGGN